MPNLESELTNLQCEVPIVGMLSYCFDPQACQQQLQIYWQWWQSCLHIIAIPQDNYHLWCVCANEIALNYPNQEKTCGFPRLHHIYICTMSNVHGKMAEFTSCTNVLFTLGCTVSCKIFSIMSLGSWIHSSLAPHFLGEFGYNPSSVCRSLHSPLNNQLLTVSHHIPSIVISYPSLYHHIYIYIYIDRGSDKGGGVVQS